MPSKPMTNHPDKPSILRYLFDTVTTIFWALLIALALRTFLIEPFKIPSGSMYPNLLVGDFLFVSKYQYGYSRFSFPLGIIPFEGRFFASTPERGDIVVFRNPKRQDINYVKRVIGLPGDDIQVQRGILFINDQPVRRIEVPLPSFIGSNGINKSYLEILPNNQQHTILEMRGDRGNADDTPRFTVPAGHYFMMGDNRDNSSDSRFLNDLGFVPFDHLIGRVEFIFYSHDLSDGYDWRFSRFFTRPQ